MVVRDIQRAAEVVRRHLTTKTELPVIASEKGNEANSGSECRSAHQVLAKPLSDNSNQDTQHRSDDEPLTKQPRLGDRTFPVSLPAPPLRAPVVQEDTRRRMLTQNVGVALSMEPSARSEGCLLMGCKREINPCAPEWKTD